MAPNHSSTAFNAEHEAVIRQAAEGDTKGEAPLVSDVDQKYLSELQRLEETKKDLMKEMEEVDGIINKNYPELAIAHAVKNDPAWRYDDEERLRVKMSLKIVRRKARRMIADALEDQQDMLKSIERRLRLAMASVAAVEINRKIQSRKRSANDAEERDDSKRARLE